MIVVLSSRFDLDARRLVERCAADGFVTLSPQDLSVRGWRHRLGDDDPGSAVVGGRIVPVRSIRAVLTRLPWIPENDLDEVAPEDRRYVAAEMTAFLVSWLSSLCIPVFNPPTTTCLLGPLWSAERWTMTASSVGLPVRGVRRCVIGGKEATPDEGDAPRRMAVVVGTRCVGAPTPAHATYALTLARAAGTPLLSVSFARDDGRFVDATPWVDLDDEEVFDAVVECLRA